MSQLFINKPTTSNHANTQALMHFVFGDLCGNGTLAVPFEVLSHSDDYRENWSTVDAVISGQSDGMQLWQSDDFLVLSLSPEGADILTVTESAYKKALSKATALDYQILVRTWNYFPRINEIDAGLERYQSFCVARQNILNGFPVFHQQNPAATAIGTHNEVNQFVFLFAKTKGQGLENNRQLPAWEYPKQYAPKQPRFARAMIHSGLLMCSGTASVVGHETQHVDDFEKQFEESLLNVQALLAQTGASLALSQGVFRFYLRSANNLSKLEHLLQCSEINHYVVLAADVCRADLLLECEAVFQI